MLLQTTAWNSMMQVGAIVAFGGMFSSLCLFSFCFLRMGHILHSKGIISWTDTFFPFSVYQKFSELAKTKSAESVKYLWHMNILQKSVIAAPLFLVGGLLMMVIGKSLQ